MVKIAFEDVYIPDISALTTRSLSDMIKKGLIRGKIVIPKELVRYFEFMARGGSAVGYIGLQELSELRNYSVEETGVSIEIVEGGVRETEELNQDMLNSIVKDLARRLGGKVVTSDPLQKAVCKAMGIDVLFVENVEGAGLWFEKYVDEETLSLHIKEGAPIMAKKGKPGEWRLVYVTDKPMAKAEIEMLIEEVVRRARNGEGVIEIERQGLMIVQLKDYRIVIVTPPISLAYEMTITKPIARLRLEDYNLPDKLVRRLNEKAEGILIAGAPGMGKTTFAQALAEYYARMGKIVKTIESPRDMRLPQTVAQYSKHYASSKDLHDLLLLSRPDYTVFDEMRDDEDFMIYTDLRLAGIGMIGVVHATSPIDAIQRFIRRVDIGMIPSIIDTVIFIDKGRVSKVYELTLTVRLPTGLREADLARPVVEVRDFLTNELEYEIYVFGEQTVVVPVKKIRSEIAADNAANIVKKLMPYANVDVTGKTVVISIPRSFYNSNTLKILRKIRKRLDKIGFDVDLKLS
ncbi:ATPase, T2SS/T4P/T4SS family [Ignisphaera sp. 4213-co]|uniref:ATPase, T2SS/T4P/T4SS family n=1 Tax=Ignisphaera cupida TaxID=3050454 RepID=A0ABD4Z392_9CREN|nr:ATPase, T2SS/T4P/T4SS family [Ignisphaera sp. 4213-co]MDK6027787.1 ATPase, T2SS/T4P/T4SS family [Ignisphaera sp. 4213-co]